MKTAKTFILILGATFITAILTEKMREGEIPHRTSAPRSYAVNKL